MKESTIYELINELTYKYNGDIEKLRDDVIKTAASIVSGNSSVDETYSLHRIVSNLEGNDSKLFFSYFTNEDNELKKKYEERIGLDFVEYHKNNSLHYVNHSTPSTVKEKKLNNNLISLLYGDFESPIQNKQLPVYQYIRKIFLYMVEKRSMNLFTGKNSLIKTTIDQRGVQYDETIIHELKQNKTILDGLISVDTGEKNIAHNNKFYKKLHRYFKMYEPILLKRLQDDMLEFVNVSTNIGLKEIEVLFLQKVKDLLDEFLHILYSFGDKLGLEQFKKILESGLSTIDLVNGEQEGKKKTLGSKHISILGFTRNIESRYQHLKDHPTLMHMYRSFSREGLSYNDDGRIMFSNSGISLEIEKHFGSSIEFLLDIYKHWFYSPSCSIEGLELIKSRIDLLLESIHVLQDKNIAFAGSDYNIRYNIDYFLHKFGTNIAAELKTELEVQTFKQLLFCKTIEELDIISEIQDKRGDALKGKISSGELGQYKDINYDQLNGKSTLYRKGYVLNNVIKLSEDNLTILSEHHLFDVYKKGGLEYKLFLKFYTSFYKKHGNDFQTYKKIFKNALKLVECGKTSLEDFEKHNIACEQILVAWFRFTLMYKKFSNQGFPEGEIIFKIKKEFDKMYANSHMIMCNLGDDFLNDPSKNIQIIDGGMTNSSGWGIKDMCKRWDLAFEKRPKDLGNESDFGFIEEGKEKYTKFNNIEGLYLPKGKKISISFDDIKKHNRNFLEFCNFLLQREGYPEKFTVYRNILIESSIDLNDYATLTKLRKFFKYNLYIVDDIEKMYKNGLENEPFLLELQTKLSEKGIYITIGGSKTPYRTFQKVVCDYDGDIRKLQDLLRGRNVSKKYISSIDNLTEVIKTLYEDPELSKDVLQIHITDNTGNPSERSDKTTGYRDMKISIKLQNQNIAELQFQLEGIYKFKDEGLEASGLVKLYKENYVKLTRRQYEIFEKNAESEGLIIPKVFQKLCGDKNYVFDEKLHGNQINEKGELNSKITSDWFYKMWRNVRDLEPEYVKVISKMEALPNLDAWGGVVYELSQYVLQTDN